MKLIIRITKDVISISACNRSGTIIGAVIEELPKLVSLGIREVQQHPHDVADYLPS
jgi:hypothetical protein